MNTYSHYCLLLVTIWKYSKFRNVDINMTFMGPMIISLDTRKMSMMQEPSLTVFFHLTLKSYIMI